jgi:aryl carrier-like protein
VHTNFPLLLLVTPGDAWDVDVTYDTSLLAGTTIARWTQDFVAALETLSTSPATTLGALLDRLSEPAPPAPAKRAWHARPLNPTPPATDSERRIADVWRNLFGVDDVGITENLFDLGAHSLLVVRLHQQLRRELGAEFPLIKLFEHPTIQSFAAFLDRPQDGAERTAELRDRAQRQREAMAKSRRLFGTRPTR